MTCPNKNMEKNYIQHIRPYLEELQKLTPVSTGVNPKTGKFKTRTVIFDIYGTLIISASGDVDKAEYNAGMIKKALKGGGFEILIDDEDAYNGIYQDFHESQIEQLNRMNQNGYPFPEADVTKIWTDILIAAEKKGRINIKENSDILLFTFILELQTNKIWPMPGMVDLINKLYNSGIELGIVSNAQFYTPVIMNYLLHRETKVDAFIKLFTPELSVFSYKEQRGKPDTFLFEKLVPELAKRNLKPQDVLYVGNDLLKDVYTAGRVGFKTVLYAGDKRSYRLHENDKRVQGIEPDYVITELKQLFNILDLNL